MSTERLPNTEQSVRIRVCECCERERQLGEAGWETTIHGDFCPECIADLRAETERLIDALPQRIALCPQCAPEFYYPLGDGEGLGCPQCSLEMVVYARRPDAAVRVALEHLRHDFEREALRLYHEDRDGSDWQEAHRRVEVLLKEIGDV